MATPPPETDLYIGRDIGNYRIESLLAAGGMGVVYRARHKGLPNLHQAVKVLAPGYAADPAARARFKYEAAAAAQVGSHHQIVRPIDTGEFPDGSPYMLMELVEGKSLQQELAERHSLPLATAADIALLIADAMVHAHRQGIVHRDLKPANIMLEGDAGKQRIKILDFGIAKAAQSLPDEYATDSGIAVGTVGYMSPEQTAGMPIDGRTDVFSWGVIFFQMLTGRPPFIAKDRKALIAQVASPACRAPKVNSLSDAEREPVPAVVEALIDRALAKEVDERPTMVEVRDDLSRIVAGSSIASPARRSDSWPAASFQKASDIPLLQPGHTEPSSSIRAARAESLSSSIGQEPRQRGPAHYRRLFSAAAALVVSVVALLLFWAVRSKASPDLTAKGWEGPWIYSIHDKSSDAWVYGVFAVEHSPSGVTIPQGQAWYAEDAPEPHTLRGTWKSKAASISESTLYVIFEMESMTQKPEAAGTRLYKGVLEMTQAGSGVLLGTYQDFGSRHEHWGSIQAERAHSTAIERAAKEAFQRFGRW